VAVDPASPRLPRSSSERVGRFANAPAAALLPVAGLGHPCPAALARMPVFIVGKADTPVLEQVTAAQAQQR